MELPGSSAEITIEWLNDALSSTIESRAITGFERAVIGEGAGFIGELTRVTLTYDDPQEGSPRSLIAKLPTGDESIRTLAQLFGFYEREIRFYEELADKIEIRTPQRYFSSADAVAGRYVLLLEDLAPGRCGDQLASCSLEEAKLALTELAKLQAAWWNSPRLSEFPWLASTDDSVLLALLQAVYQHSWPKFEEEFTGLLPTEVIDIGRKFGEQLAALGESLSGRPRTILHTDFRLDNMFFDLADGSPFALIDWQLVQQGLGPSDVTYFLAGNFTPDARRQHEAELLRTYHEALVQHGVADYSFEQCLEEYRMSALNFFIFLVTGRENVDMAAYAGRGQTLLDTMVERYTTAILDLRAADFLPA
ncbi:MAG: phosphotransferase [Dehalococcoidia bacterium]